MRVIAGKARRLLLKTPAGPETRPTTDRIKETLFNMLQDEVPGAVFVDLFSGSGGIGIEALSRGAGHAYFAETSKNALACIRANLRTTHLEDDATVLAIDAAEALRRLERKKVTADIIFMDPPYDCGWEERMLTLLATSCVASEDTLIIIEASMDTDFPYLEELGFALLREKCYKTNKHVWIQKKEQKRQ